jgi:hypothetical protein
MAGHTPQNAHLTLQAEISALEAQGGDQFDIVRFQFIRSMATRAQQLDKAVAVIVANKALAVLQDYQSDLARERQRLSAIVEETGAHHPAARAELQSLFDAGKLPAVKRLAARLSRHTTTARLAPLLDTLESAPLKPTENSFQRPASDLLQGQENAVLDSLATDPPDAAARPAEELKSARYFRELRQHRAAQDRVSQAIQDAPEDSGPLNPHKLAIRSLLAMRELSPSYLARFVSYVDTLFWLENTGSSDK